MTHCFRDASLFIALSPPATRPSLGSRGGDLQVNWVRRWTRHSHDNWQRSCGASVLALAYVDSSFGPSSLLRLSALSIFDEEDVRSSGLSSVSSAADRIDRYLQSLGAIVVPDGLWKNEDVMMNQWRSVHGNEPPFRPRPTKASAYAMAEQALEEQDPDLFELYNAGSADIHMVKDGSPGDAVKKVGWAWWLTVDGEEVSGTHYINNDLTWQMW